MKRQDEKTRTTLSRGLKEGRKKREREGERERERERERVLNNHRTRKDEKMKR